MERFGTGCDGMPGKSIGRFGDQAIITAHNSRSIPALIPAAAVRPSTKGLRGCGQGNGQD